MSFDTCSECRTKVVPALKRAFQVPHFKTTPDEQRLLVGNIVRALESEESCSICRFFVATLQLRTRDDSYRIYGDNENTNIYFVTDPTPWYQKAGIYSSIPACPFVWLQIGPKAEEPLICISLEPMSENTNEPMPLPDRLYPRQRSKHEAYNGNVLGATILNWLRKCERKHPQCRSVSEGLPDDFLLIDVQQRCLKNYAQGDRFLTLSYVWGKGASEQNYWLTSSSTTAQSRPLTHGAGMELPQALPQTIEDALHITRQLEERYLWVDLFCIDQNNYLKKQNQIEAMDAIFAASWLTLVCVNGGHANYGLTGVSRYESQTRQPRVVTQIGRLMATHIHSHWDHNGDSEWDLRAWTLQERLLSRRCLFFADTYYSMLCKAELFHDLVSMNIEDSNVVLGQDNTYFREDGSSLTLDEEEWTFDTYGNLVSVFTGRDITDPNDIHNACRGSLKRIMMKTGADFHFGLPKGDLLQALHWVPHQQHVPKRRLGFPSWSWLGWTGRSEYSYWLHNWNTHPRPHEPSARERRRLNEEALEFEKRNAVSAAQSIHDATMTAPVIQLRTVVKNFKVHLLCRSGEPFRLLPDDEIQAARGDHWALVDGKDHKIINPTGEDEYFHSGPVSFRLHPEQSDQLYRQQNRVDLVFLKHWPYIWDAVCRKNNIVTAIVVFKDKDGSHNRLACVTLTAEAWLAATGRVEIVTIV